MQETRVRSLGWEDPLEKEMATHSSFLAWRILWTEQPGGLQSMGSQTVGHDWVTNTHFPRSVLDTFQPWGMGRGVSSYGVISFYLFILFMDFLCQEYWSGLPFPPPADHVLSELSTMTCPSWVVLHSMTHSFFELHKPLHHEPLIRCSNLGCGWGNDRTIREIRKAMVDSWGWSISDMIRILATPGKCK